MGTAVQLCEAWNYWTTIFINRANFNLILKKIVLTVEVCLSVSL
jgi:hypothetical protein